MNLGKLVEKTIKVTRTVSKAGAELGADIVGMVVEKVNSSPEVKKG